MDEIRGMDGVLDLNGWHDGLPALTKKFIDDLVEPEKASGSDTITILDPEDGSVFAHISFHHGPAIEGGRLGTTMRSVLGAIAQRLRNFQEGEFKCRENAIAITKIEEAIHRLDDRENDRADRGVEGKDEV